VGLPNLQIADDKRVLPIAANLSAGPVGAELEAVEPHCVGFILSKQKKGMVRTSHRCTLPSGIRNGSSTRSVAMSKK